MVRSPRPPRAVLAACLLVLLLPVAGGSVARAQEVLRVREKLAFDRPESWALAYFASASLLGELGAPADRPAGSLELGLELGTIPRLGEASRRVGFGGTKVEDLNRSPVLARPRLTVGLPARFAVTFAWLPPVEVDRAKTQLFSLALDRLLVDSGTWSAGARLYAQTGTARGDFTCPASAARFAPGSAENPYGCHAPSKDEATLDYAGFELTGARRFAGPGRPRVFLSVAANRMDLAFQVRASTYDILDRTHEETHGWTWSATAGAEWDLGSRTGFSIAGFYTPLSVERPPGSPAGNDPFVNARALLSYRVR